MTSRKTKTKIVSMKTLMVLEVKNSRTNSYCVSRLAYSPVDPGRAESEEFSTFSNRR